MSTKQSMADQIRRLAGYFEAMKEVADIIEEVGSLEGHKAELERARDLARDEHAKTVADLKVAKGELHDVKVLAKRAAETSEQRAAETLSLANGERDRILAEAKAQGAEIVEKAKAQVAAVKAELAQTRADAEGAAVNMAEKLRTLDEQIEAKQAEHDALVKKYDKLKASIAKLAVVSED